MFRVLTRRCPITVPPRCHGLEVIVRPGTFATSPGLLQRRHDVLSVVSGAPIPRTGRWIRAVYDQTRDHPGLPPDARSHARETHSSRPGRLAERHSSPSTSHSNGSWHYDAGRTATRSTSHGYITSARSSGGERRRDRTLPYGDSRMPVRVHAAPLEVCRRRDDVRALSRLPRRAPLQTRLLALVSRQTDARAGAGSRRDRDEVVKALAGSRSHVRRSPTRREAGGVTHASAARPRR